MWQRRMGIVVGLIVVAFLVVWSYARWTRARVEPAAANDATLAATAPVTPTSPTASMPAGTAQAATGSGAKRRPRDPSAVEETSAFGAPGSLAKVPARYEGTAAGGYYVNLAGGPAAMYAGGVSTDRRPMHALAAHVVDGQGAPIAGAIVVVAADRVSVMGGALMGEAGGTTDATGRVTFEAPAAAGFAIAIAASGWSEPFAYAEPTTTLELAIRGRGALRGRATYNGHAESFVIDLVNPIKTFTLHYESNPDGTFEIAALPPGAYSVSIGLAQSITGGASKKDLRDVVIENGKTAEIVVEQKSATDLVVTAKPPAGLHPSLVQAYVFTGTAAVDPTTAKQRQKTEHAPALLFGGADADKPIQFHDVAAGTYTVCEAAGDTLKTLGSLWACTPVRVLDGDEVREVELQLAPVAKP